MCDGSSLHTADEIPCQPFLSLMMPTSLNDLPPELLDLITTYLPTAQSLSNLGRTNKSLQTFVEKDAWQTFSRTRFPSLYTNDAPLAKSHRDGAKSLTTLSKAWDRRAFVSRYIEPHGDIRAYPGDRRIDRWKRPRGQTIGFTPQLDSYESINTDGRLEETLAFTAGAEICLRKRSIEGAGADDVRWFTYRSLSSAEGRDDVTCMHLLKPLGEERQRSGPETVVAGTANGDLHLLSLPPVDGSDIVKAHFSTSGRGVRSSSLFQETYKPILLAANLGDSHVALYSVDSDAEKIEPTTETDIRPHMVNGRRGQRAWSTNFISSTRLAIGLGPSEEPLHIYTLSPSGLEKEPTRKFALQNDLDKLEGEITLSGFAKRSASSIYPVIPLSPVSASAGGSEEGQVFLSGAYDGIIRLHDLRSNRNVEQAYIDPTDDSAIYSLLPRGRETLVAGTSRHSLLKVFDPRLGAKAYDYLDATSPIPMDEPWKRRPSHGKTKDWSLFLKPHSATYPGRGGGNNWARRSAESSIYTLTSPSPTSPYIYAGVENAVVEMAFTSLLDAHPDPSYFQAPRRSKIQQHHSPSHHRRNSSHAASTDLSMIGGMRPKEILDLAMYDQTADMKLCTQRSVWETFRLRDSLVKGHDVVEGRDERWKVGS